MALKILKSSYVYLKDTWTHGNLGQFEVTELRVVITNQRKCCKISRLFLQILMLARDDIKNSTKLNYM